MSCGKYSPTVSKSYMVDRDWFRKVEDEEGFDPDGYDRYGYHKDTCLDRAEKFEDDYLVYDEDLEAYAAYERVADDWRDVIIKFE